MMISRKVLFNFCNGAFINLNFGFTCFVSECVLIYKSALYYQLSIMLVHRPIKENIYLVYKMDVKI